MSLSFQKPRPRTFPFASQRKRESAGFLLERPGSEHGSWERWIVRGDESAKVGDDSPTPGSAERVVILPTGCLHAWPLWIATEGDAGELVRMELSGRHLLRRGMESSLVVLPVISEGERRLVLAVCPEEPFPEKGMPPGWEEAGLFGLHAASWGGEADLAVWFEWGSLHLAFYREGTPVWFCEAAPDSLPQLAFRCALKLREEGVIASMPRRILLAGLGEGSSRRLSGALAAVFQGASVISRPSAPPPAGSPGKTDLPPSIARESRTRRIRRERLLNLAAVAAGIYALLILWVAADLFMKRGELRKLRSECALLEPKAAVAKASSEKWKALRGAVDPSLFALDLLAVVAGPTEGGKIRLTRFSVERGRVQISAEATDVTQAYSFIERIKKSPELSAYDWNSGQPQLAGKNSVRFDMEGTNRDEKPGT